MLNRQKTLLYMLQRVGREATKIEVTKWCFLLRHEMPSEGGSSFYQFLPYHYGPFSNCLTREADSLVSEGYIKPGENQGWIVREDLSAVTANLSPAVKKDIDRIIERFGQKQQNRLLDYVYERFPAFTVNSKRKRLAERVTAEPAVYTAGYEGLLIDGFLNILIQAGVKRLIDVRHNPVARRFGFHKSTLNRLAGGLGIDYVHVPELGIESEDRQGLSDRRSYERLFRRYERNMLPKRIDAVKAVSEKVLEVPSVLVCMEANPCSCHRSRLAKVVAEQTGLPIVHLGVDA